MAGEMWFLWGREVVKSDILLHVSAVATADSKFQSSGYCLIFQRYLWGWRDDLGVKSSYCSGGGLDFYS